MEWWLVLLLIFGSLIVLMATGMPVAFAFLIINIAGVLFVYGGEPGLRQLILSLAVSVKTFSTSSL